MHYRSHDTIIFHEGCYIVEYKTETFKQIVTHILQGHDPLLLCIDETLVEFIRAEKISLIENGWYSTTYECFDYCI